MVAVALATLVASFAVAYAIRQTTAEPPAGAPATVDTPRPALPTVAAAELPAEAREMLSRIDTGGPFAYAKDGSLFGNLEGLLPNRDRGYYREYTVPTPGGQDRGARRLVAGRDGDVYWTDDHYASFRQVLR
jgi:ribonuclease T1